MAVSPSVSNLYPNLSSLSQAQFQTLAEAATAWTIRHIGWDFTPGTKTETFSPVNEPILFLSCRPVASITSVVINGSTADPSSYNCTPNGLLTRQKIGLWNQLGGWSAGLGLVTVTYVSSGMAQPTIDLLVGAIMNWFCELGNRSPTVASERIGDYSATYQTPSEAIPGPIIQMLYPYRRIMAG